MNGVAPQEQNKYKKPVQEKMQLKVVFLWEGAPDFQNFNDDSIESVTDLS
jgi:hypothetical protein